LQNLEHKRGAGKREFNIKIESSQPFKLILINNNHKISMYLHMT
jgi:hypothetical protein